MRRGLTVAIKWSKTNQRAQDDTALTLPRIPGRAFCPVHAMDALTILNPVTAKTDPLFMTREGRPLCLGLLKKAWKDTLHRLALPADRLSLHSLKAGGATAVWGTGQVSELDLMKHGTWSSTAWKGYIRPTGKGSTIIKGFRHI